jgi:hypothetical protein
VITFIPFSRNSSLVNRDDAFKTLDRLLSPLSPNRSAAIWGLGGCGYVDINIYRFTLLTRFFLGRRRSLLNMHIAVKTRLRVLSSGFMQILRLDSLRTIVILARSRVSHWT